MFAEIFNEEIISMLLEYAIKIIVLVLGTFAVNIISKYKLEKKIKDLVWYAEQVYEKEGMGKYKREEVINYFSKKLGMNSAKMKEIIIILEKEVKKLNLLQQLPQETPIIVEIPETK